MPASVNSTLLKRLLVPSALVTVTTDFTAFKDIPAGRAGDTVKLNIGVFPGDDKLVPPVGMIADPPTAFIMNAENAEFLVAVLLLINVVTLMLGRRVGGTIPVGLG